MDFTIDPSKDDPMGYLACYGARAVFGVLIISIIFIAADSMGFKIGNISLWYNLTYSILSFILGLMLGGNIKK